MDQTHWFTTRRVLVLLIAVAALAFSSAMRGPFFLDDAGSIPGNTTLRDAWPPAAALSPQPGTAVAGRPIANYSFAINESINRAVGLGSVFDSHENTLGFHAGNLLLHLASGLVLFAFVRRTLWRCDLEEAEADQATLLATAVWLTHPIQTEAVNYVVQRTELLVSFWYLATMYASTRAWDASSPNARRGWYLLAVVVCLLGMGSKEVMITAPVMVVLYDLAFRVADWRKALRSGRVWFYLALAATSAWTIALVATGARNRTVGFETGVTALEYAYSQGWAIAQYVRLLVLPVGLTLDYGAAPVTNWTAAVGALLVVAALGATVVAWTRGGRMRQFAFAGVWFFLILAPSSSIVPIVTEIAAERRVYLAIASPIVVAAIFAVRWWSNAASPARRAAIGTGVIAVVVGLAVATFVRGRVYGSVEGMWRDVIAKRPANARAYLNLGNVYLTANPPQLARADSMYRRATALDSMSSSAWFNLAEVALSRNDESAARPLLQKTLTIDPGHVKAAERLGGILVASGDAANAVPLLERVVNEAPTDEAALGLADAYAAVGKPQEAANLLRQLVARQPPSPRALSQFGALLVQYGRAAEGLPYLEEAVRLKPNAVNLALLSLAYASHGDLPKAFARAAESAADPSATAYSLTVCGWSLRRAGRPQDAERLFRRALSARPGYPLAQAALDQLVGGRDADTRRR